MERHLIILVGPQGAGKTRYALTELRAGSAKQLRAGNAEMVRISQDDGGKKAHREEFVRRIDVGDPVVVDRINHTREQRARYIDYARQNGYRVKMVWFDVDWGICYRRLRNPDRKNHPTVGPDADHEAVLDVYFKNFEPPEQDEYDELKVIAKREYARILDLRDEMGDRRCIVVSDIHGCFDEFMRLLLACEYREGDFVVSVGDLTDRGPKSPETLQWFRQTPNAYAVQGNHDDKLRRYLEGHRVKLNHGLSETVSQLADDFNRASYAAWIASWPHIIRLPDLDGKPLYVVHAGVDGGKPIEEQRTETCLYARYFGGKGFLDESGTIWYETLNGAYYIVSGHMIHKEVPKAACAFCIDGGACKGGKMRAFLPDEKRIVETEGYVAPVTPCIELPALEAVRARDRLVDEGMLRCDDLDDLRVYTYTDACTFSRAWDDITRASRGVVLNRKTGEVVAKTFSKFFNIGETPETLEHCLPWSEVYAVYQKMDGWLGNLFRHKGEYRISTRGSFRSPGAVWATRYLQENHDLTGLPNEATLVFELINRSITKIIVDYGNKEELVLLAAFNRHTGEEYNWDQIVEWGEQFGFALPQVYEDGIEGCKQLLADSVGTQMEGFVIRFENGLRVKMKGEDYLRRVRILSRLTPLAVWEAMIDGVVGEQFRSVIDADYRPEMDSIADELEQKYADMMIEIDADFSTVIKAIRKPFALAMQDIALRHKAIMFARLDERKGKIDKYVKREIRPKGNELFGK